MNYSIIFKMLSMVLWVMALAFSACTGVSLLYDASPLESEAMPSWICVIALCVMLAFALYLPSRNAPKKLFKKEAMCVVGLGWIIASAVGSLPYALILGCGFPDAFFESTSGLTTTGSSVFSSFADFPHSLMFWRCLSHWIGGMGVLVFFVAILSFMGSGGRILYASESSANAGGGIETARIQSGIFKILALYLGVSALCLAAFKLCGMGWFDGVCHMFSAVATGGFSVYENGMAHYDSNAVYWATTFFMFVGGVSFMPMLAAIGGDFKKLASNTEFRTYSAILLVSTAAVAAFIAQDFRSASDWGDAITKAAFESVSLMTTTGFAGIDYGTWLPATHAIFFVLIIIGGCAGSTSGGLKVSRAVAAFKIACNEVEKSFRPRVVRNISVNGKSLDDSDIKSVLSHCAIFFGLSLCATVLLAILEPDMSLEGTLSAAIACLNNIGPGFAEVGPSKNFGFFGDSSKIISAFLMITGRLEFYAILVLFLPSLWKKFQ